MTLLKWAFTVVAALIAIAAIIYGVGATLPRHHVAQAERVIAMPADAVAARLRAVREYPRWRPGIVLVVTGEEAGAISFVETQDGDRISYRLTEPEPGRRFVATLTDETLPFGGQWTFLLEPQGEATLVRIEEDGEIRDPLYRFFARFVFGYTSTMNGYLDRLAES